MKFIIILVLITFSSCSTLFKPTKNEELLHAARSGDLIRVKELVGKGANVNYKAHGMEGDITPLGEALYSCNFNIIKFLVEKGADVNKMYGHNSILDKAVWYCNLDIVKYLLGNGSYLNVDCSDYLLYSAANHYDTLKYLIDLGVCVDTKNYDGDTPMHRAVDMQNINSVELLYKHGVRVDSANNSGVTPLHVCTRVGNYQIANWLIKKGAPVDSMDDKNETPLHYAAYHNKIDIIRLLLMNNANSTIVNKYGKRPIDIAIENNYSKAIELLKNIGKK